MAGMWSDDETLKLVEIWGNDVIQAKLEGCIGVIKEGSEEDGRSKLPEDS